MLQVLCKRFKHDKLLNKLTSMKVAIATPLYPPEIAEPAPYSKELAKRLKDNHSVTIIAYTHLLPEKVPGVEIIAIKKHNPLPIRLFLYTIALFKVAIKSDLIFTQNGPSVELPVLLISLMTRVPIVMNISDKPAHNRAKDNSFINFIEKYLQNKSVEVITKNPLEKPEILPLEEMPTEKINSYNKSWEEHVGKLNEIFKKASRK